MKHFATESLVADNVTIDDVTVDNMTIDIVTMDDSTTEPLINGSLAESHNETNNYCTIL